MTTPEEFTDATDFLVERQVIFDFVPYTLSLHVFPIRSVTVFLFIRTVAAEDFDVSGIQREVQRQRTKSSDKIRFVILIVHKFLSDRNHMVAPAGTTMSVRHAPHKMSN